MGRIKVDLGERSYPIVIERGLIEKIGPLMKDMGFSGPAALITNTTVGLLYGGAVCGSLEGAGFVPSLITMPDGEEYKNVEELSKIYDCLVAKRLERTSPIVALGGGVVGDIAGFAAATYMRGVPYIQVPTTLLAQVDSSVGGKTAVNHPKGKNLIGAFYQPRAVFMDPEVLKTLEAREIRAGLAEVVKYGVIRDKEFFGFLEGNRAVLANVDEPLIKAIERSCEIKASIVCADETEKDLRSILNFGHTFGHAIETLTGYGTYKHGEAVSIGMCMASALSVRLGFSAPEVAGRIKGLLSSIGLPVERPGIGAEKFIETMRLDKKVCGARLRFVLPSDIGRVILRDLSEAELFNFLEEFK